MFPNLAGLIRRRFCSPNLVEKRWTRVLRLARNLKRSYVLACGVESKWNGVAEQEHTVGKFGTVGTGGVDSHLLAFS